MLDNNGGGGHCHQQEGKKANVEFGIVEYPNKKKGRKSLGAPHSHLRHITHVTVP